MMLPLMALLTVGAGCNGGSSSNSGGIYQHDETVVDGDTTWSEGTHILGGDLQVINGTLTVEPCSTIQMAIGGSITVEDGGALRLVGRPDCPITVTSSKEPAGRGDWRYIEFMETSAAANNVFQHVIVEYGGGADYGALWIGDGASLEMRDCEVHQSAHHAIQLRPTGSLRNFQNNDLHDNAKRPLELYADHVDELGPGVYTPNEEEGIRVLHDVVRHDASWQDLGVPYVAPDGFSVGSDDGSAQLTLAAGVSLLLGQDASIDVDSGGGLTLDGTADAPVVVSSAAATPSAGDWGYIEFNDGSSSRSNVFRNAVIEYGGGADFGAIWIGHGASVAIDDCVIRDSGHHGVQVTSDGELRSFSGNAVHDCALAPLELPPAMAGVLSGGGYAPNGIQAIKLLHGSVDSSATWAALGVPYLAQEGFMVQTEVGTATLTIAAGNTLLMGDDAVLNVSEGGKLIVEGTAADPVYVTSANEQPAAGDWAYIELYSRGNVFSHTEISYGGAGGDYGQLWVADDAEVSLVGVDFFGGLNCDISGDGTVNSSESNGTRCQ